ncbi:hypothetical protein DL239_10975 [Sedimentitalea sp. CY04]|uniref:Uncharacterized protein n=1 Tax=Parasedimentitalea denitrificans TaxID=2211118 RepID=A0ABX0WB17_9RHOB|nr:hypothetical protein [Sedimentitalea sp. CY04]NIZ61500.1 hypothetical protein [Sedimentitalea sp. CY04]
MTDATASSAHSPTNQTAKSEMSTDAKMFLAIAVFLALWALSVVIWGIPGLYMPAVALVPVIFGLLMLITRG